jgi:hypothetical protein
MIIKDVGFVRRPGAGFCAVPVGDGYDLQRGDGGVFHRTHDEYDRYSNSFLRDSCQVWTVAFGVMALLLRHLGNAITTTPLLSFDNRSA